MNFNRFTSIGEREYSAGLQAAMSGFHSALLDILTAHGAKEAKP